MRKSQKLHFFFVSLMGPFRPWDNYERGRLFLAKNELLKAARCFMKAGREMSKKGYRSLAESAFKEAQKTYQGLSNRKFFKMEWEDQYNFGTIDAFLNPNPEEGMIIETDHLLGDKSTIWGTEISKKRPTDNSF
jgi:hypothetical protein